jgi:hypothetical protein
MRDLARRLLVAVALSAAPAAAEPAPAHHALARLSYVRGPGAETCIAAPALSAAVEARLGRRVFVQSEPADLLVVVAASRAGQGFAIKVALVDAKQRRIGERRLVTRARHCSALDDSLALVVALAADVAPHAVPTASAADATDASVATSAAAASSNVRAETTLTIPEATAAPRAPFAFQPSLGGAFALGLLPRFAAGAEVSLAIVPPRFWTLVFAVALWHDQSLGSSHGARFDAQTLRFGVCPFETALERWHFRACADESFGAMHVRGFGFDKDQFSTRWLGALGAGASARHGFGVGFAGVSGSLLVPLVQRRYFYAEEGSVTLYRAPGVFALGTLFAGFEL